MIESLCHYGFGIGRMHLDSIENEGGFLIHQGVIPNLRLVLGVD